MTNDVTAWAAALRAEGYRIEADASAWAVWHGERGIRARRGRGAGAGAERNLAEAVEAAEWHKGMMDRLAAFAVEGYVPDPEDTVIDLRTGVVGTAAKAPRGAWEITSDGEEGEPLVLYRVASDLAPFTLGLPFWNAAVAFVNEGKSYGTVGLTLIAADAADARWLALRASEESVYDDDRIPNRRREVTVSECHDYDALMEEDPDVEPETERPAGPGL